MGMRPVKQKYNRKDPASMSDKRMGRLVQDRHEDNQW